MKISVKLTDAKLMLYRGGKRDAWTYTENEVGAQFFNVQASKYYSGDNGGTRIIFEWASDDEEELNRIDALSDSSWTVEGEVCGFKKIAGQDKNGKPEERIIFRLKDYTYKADDESKMNKRRTIHVVPKDSKPSQPEASDLDF